MTQFVFGTGTLVMKRTDVANAPPALLGTLQDVSIDFDRKIELLLGQHNVAVALAGGELKISGKAKFARFQAALLNNLFFGQTLTQNAMLEMTTGEPVVPSAGSFTVASGATFVEDLGLFYAATGVALTPVAASPTQGQYVPGTAGAGIYTTASADAGTAMICYYSYTSASGNKIVAANQLMGAIPTFALYMKQSFDHLGSNKDLILKLNACSSSKIALAFSAQKFAVPEFDFQAQADAANNWGTLSLSE